ncbi:hypothetical protein D3C87_1397840 [compost metagenome]
MQLTTQPVRTTCQQPFERLQYAPGRSVHCLDQRLAGLRLAPGVEQQRNFLRQRHRAEHLPTGLLTLFEQNIQTPFGQHRLALDHLQQGLLQFDVQRQLRMEFRWCCGVLAVVGLAQSRQPRFGKIGAPLSQPEFAFDQGDHRQIVDWRHVPDVHQPFRFGKLGKGFGKLATAPFEPGDHAMADQHTDVAAGASLVQPCLQAPSRRLWLQAQRQQKPFVQGQSGADGVEPLR